MNLKDFVKQQSETKTEPCPLITLGLTATWNNSEELGWMEGRIRIENTELMDFLVEKYGETRVLGFLTCEFVNSVGSYLDKRNKTGESKA